MLPINTVLYLIFFRDTLDVVKQSAALCLLRLFRTDPNIIPSGEWTSRIIHLLNDQHMGVVTAATSLIDALVKKNPDEYKGCVSLAVSRLSRVRKKNQCATVWKFENFSPVQILCVTVYISDCHVQLHRFPRLYLLFCASTMALC